MGTDGYREKKNALRILLAASAILLGSELASAQSQERVCWIDQGGVRHCEVRPVGPGPGHPPPHNPPPQNPPPYYPPPHNPPPYNPPPYYPQPTPPPYYPTPTPPPYYPPQPGYSYTIDAFRQDETEVLRWQSEYNRAPSGSWQEQYARQQRDSYIQHALDTLRGYGALQNETSQTLQAFACELDDKYQRASSGSAVESLYDQARRIAWPSFRDAVLSEQRFVTDVSQLEQLARQYADLYQRASSGSLRESIYRDLRDQLLSLAENAFRSQVGYMSQQDLYSWAQYYDDLYRRASSGSALERHYREMRDIARSRLGYNPYP